MTVSSTTVKQSYSGNGSTSAFSYSFKINSTAELKVIIRTDSNGTETVKTLTTHYNVSDTGSGGTVTFTSGNIPASGETVVLIRETNLTQTTDYVENDPFPAESHESALDKLTLQTQELQEELDRSIKLSRTNTMTSTEFTVGSTDRADKILAFDSSGEISVTQELGTFKGNWAASTDYVGRDIVKDTSTNNIFIVNTAHTSSGSQPLTTNANSAKYDLLVDASSATTSQTAAASSATAAASSATAASSSASTASTQATNAASSATAAATSATAAETAKTAAETAKTAAETALDNFDDIFLGAKSSDPSTDNDGDALTAGDLYFNTTSNSLKVFNGSAFQDAALTAANFLTVANNLSDLNNAGTARTNLGLGTASTQTIATLQDIVNDTTPQLGGDLDTNSANIKIDDAHGLFDENNNEQLIFQTTASAVNFAELTNSATGNDVGLAVDGTDTNVGLSLSTKGSGKFKFNDAAYFPEATLTDGSTVSWDVQSSPVAKVTLGGNRSLGAGTNGVAGQFVSLLVIQDGTGSRTLSFNAVYEFKDDTAPTLTTTAAKGDLFVFRYNGSKFLEVGRNLNLTLS